MKTILLLVVLIGCKGDKGVDNLPEGTKRIPEAVRQLDNVAKAAKSAFADSGKFPIGTSNVLPERNGDMKVAGGCCGSKSNPSGEMDNKCAVSTAWASDPTWKALGFSIDEPTLNRLKYESSDGKSFVATATADADCDGEEAVFTIKGTLVDGKPKVELGAIPNHVY
jgi:hypothetical protein